MIFVDLRRSRFKTMAPLDSTRLDLSVISPGLGHTSECPTLNREKMKKYCNSCMAQKKNDFQHSNGSTLLCCVLTLGFPTFQVLPRVFSKHLFLPTLLQPWHLEKVFPNPLALPACLVKVRLVAVALYVACFCLYVKC